jgi:hypothetical protein
MTIKFDASKVSPSFKNYRDKECVQKYFVVACVDNEINTIMELGIYTSRNKNSSDVYANFNTYGLGDYETGIYSKGSGKASGGNYDKHSSAAHQAIANAGIVSFTSPCESSIKQVLLQIANDFGYKVVMVAY